MSAFPSSWPFDVWCTFSTAREDTGHPGASGGEDSQVALRSVRAEGCTKARTQRSRTRATNAEQRDTEHYEQSSTQTRPGPTDKERTPQWIVPHRIDPRASAVRARLVNAGQVRQRAGGTSAPAIPNRHVHPQRGDTIAVPSRHGEPPPATAAGRSRMIAREQSDRCGPRRNARAGAGSAHQTQHLHGAEVTATSSRDRTVPATVAHPRRRRSPRPVSPPREVGRAAP